MSDDLVKRLRAAAKHPMMDNNCKADVFDVADAADRIEELEKACKEWSEVSQANYQRAKAAEEKLAVVVVALGDLHHAVCGETGFAHCVRVDSGKAYPWPALDMADLQAGAALAKIKSQGDEFAMQK